jgi:predicted trehalose synthase
LFHWVVAQRWFSGDGSESRLRELASWSLPGTDDVDARVILLVDEANTPPVLYQVPVTVRAWPLADADSALIASWPTSDAKQRFLYDGTHDPVFARQLLELIVGGRHAEGAGASANGVPLGGTESETQMLAIGTDTVSGVIRGEQSNTSIVYRFPAGSGRAPIVCKVFRILHAGVNPDVELQAVLTSAGSTRVPDTIGSIVGQWPAIGRPEAGRSAGGEDDPGAERHLASGHLAFAQLFIDGARDAWALALAAAKAGEDFSERARELGRATAEIHQSLARALPTRAAADADIAEFEERWRRRLSLAAGEVPGLERFESAITDVYERAAGASWPTLQRIHGDLHLGQALIAPDGGCLIVDFEGEPMRPMSERAEPDLALRDVAGMLRSFDYVRGALLAADGITSWTHAARLAYLDGYNETIGSDPGEHRELLEAFELDKAVYEALYESRHRPEWLPIPLSAVERLVERSATSGSPSPGGA